MPKQSGYYLQLLSIILLTTFAKADAEFKGVIPKGVKLTYLYRPSNSDKLRQNNFTDFGIDNQGVPVFLRGNIFFRLPEKIIEKSAVFKIAGQQEISSFAFMSDGALLLIRGQDLGTVTINGFKKLQNLPAKGMRLESASDELCYIFGGNDRAIRRHLYLYRKDGKLLQLLLCPSPLGAISGDGKTSFIAYGNNIVLLTGGQKPKLLLQTQTKINSLALAAPHGLFYATEKQIGFLPGRGKSYNFLSIKKTQLKCYKNILYLLTPTQGLLKISPLLPFEKLAQVLSKEPSP